MTSIHLGYEIGTGASVTVPLRHMVVTGQTQEAGKTTTLEALIDRAGLPAIAFITKRGEQSFLRARRVEPYFRERADWQFVASVLEATMREKLKFERAWIMRASKGARTLADVQRNVRRLMEKAKGLSADVYYTLDQYLDIVVPRIATVKFARTVDLQPGLNVIDMSDRQTFPSEMQGLVMRSVLEWVYEHAQGVITIIPEAWEFAPQGRGSPVKLALVELIRKGAGLKNYVWLDSQDIGGVDKELLRSCPVWLLGVQREANEIKRVLENIPAGIAKPKASDVATLERGQFYACHGRTVIKTYVQPRWLTPENAIEVATGRVHLSVLDLVTPAPKFALSGGHGFPQSLGSDSSEAVSLQPIDEDDLMSNEALLKLDRIIELLSNPETPAARALREGIQGNAPPTAKVGEWVSSLKEIDLGQFYEYVKARALKEAPALLRVLTERSEIEVKVERKIITVDDSSAQGMCAILIKEGFFDQPAKAGHAWKEAGKRWSYKGISARFSEQLDNLTKLGFVRKEEAGYVAIKDAKERIRA